jgi:hypothetical protein
MGHPISGNVLAEDPDAVAKMGTRAGKALRICGEWGVSWE